MCSISNKTILFHQYLLPRNIWELFFTFTILFIILIHNIETNVNIRGEKVTWKRNLEAPRTILCGSNLK